jgi:CDP-glucose 4,6-dehydratase
VDTNLLPFERRLSGERILVTGHTGFTGGWLTAWLAAIGAEVHGLALAPETSPNLFEAARIGEIVRHRLVDVRSTADVLRCMTEIQPSIVVHLAAQPLVRRAYREPVETFATNVMGTANVLEAARAAGTRAAVVITTDKVYRNREWMWSYREVDELGGKDPYSASKACAELVAASYQASYGPGGLAIATARGGNIIGGGDWSEDRLIPDYVRAILSNQPIVLRNPKATRPWQHVLSVCHGYLMLAAAMLERPAEHVGGWNLGPTSEEIVPVGGVIERLSQTWRAPAVKIEPANLAEAQLLALDSTKARNELGWHPSWPLETVLARTAGWYRDFHDGRLDARALLESQIAEYRQAIAWPGR